MSCFPVIGLALGAGAAKGLAHLGVLKVLVREKIPINLITGSSIGSVMGALYASGADLQILEKICCTLQQKQLIDLVVPRLGLIKGERIEALLKVLTKNLNFEQLKVPLYVVAVDIERREEVILERGSVAEAVRASISIPGIFQPKCLEGKLLVDGAVLNRVPVNLARQKGAQVVVAVDLKFGGETGKSKPVKNIFDVIFTSIELLENSNRQDYKQQADILLEPKVAHIGHADFHRAEECIALGEMEAEAALPKIRELLSLHSAPACNLYEGAFPKK
ncbi:patatin-like phospholipase family protein [Zhaonella formicivorans]|uniref:patatin-like phospholipase family protein n=1 Tax=Zhaonella formicivorans TaxID=2528593 RepID=UPI001D118F1F|nr:patatin-like phospholipase family protein [Zhaonella formicivorans]